MIVELLTEHHLEFLSLKGGCRGSSESVLVKMSNCWKSHATAQFTLGNVKAPMVTRTNWWWLISALVLAENGGKGKKNLYLLTYRGSYMSAHVLLNLLNELGKREKMRGLPSILSLFRNEFNKFNNTRARMLDSIYHMTNTLKSHFWRKNVMILSSCTQRCYGRNNVSRKSINH